MATVTVKWRLSSRIKMEGIIYYQVIHCRRTKWISASFSIPYDAWDKERQTIVATDERYATQRLLLEDDVAHLRRLIRGLDADRKPYTVDEVVRKYRDTRSRLSLLAYIRAEVDRLLRANRYGTARNYAKTARSVAAFMGGVDLSLTALDERFVAEYNVFLLRRGLVRNSISFYMRILRAICNRAVKQRLIEPRAPFEGVYTGIDQTAKRAVKETIIVQLNRLPLPEHSPLTLARDLFLFSYSARGMSFVDLAYLKWSNIQDGVIRYVRRKTGQLLTIRVEKCMQRVMERYRQPNSPYVFPLLSTTDPAVAYTQYSIAINEYNRQLHRLSQLLPEQNKLTSYTSRHSWATAARDHQIPLAVISAGMGHRSEQTTRIYLASLENSIIDDANRNLLGWME